MRPAREGGSGKKGTHRELRDVTGGLWRAIKAAAAAVASSDTLV